MRHDWGPVQTISAGHSVEYPDISYMPVSPREFLAFLFLPPLLSLLYIYTNYSMVLASLFW